MRAKGITGRIFGPTANDVEGDFVDNGWGRRFYAESISKQKKWPSEKLYCVFCTAGKALVGDSFDAKSQENERMLT
jgi:hypothetical protein